MWMSQWLKTPVPTPTNENVDESTTSSVGTPIVRIQNMDESMAANASTLTIENVTESTTTRFLVLSQLKIQMWTSQLLKMPGLPRIKMWLVLSLKIIKIRLSQL